MSTTQKENESIHLIKENLQKTTVIPNVLITPEIASWLLSLNERNRKIKDHIVLEYAREMTSKNWIFNGDSIRLSLAGHMLDGQHKCLAIIKSKIPQILNVQTGLVEEAFAYIDRGRARTASDVLHIYGLAKSSTIATAIKLIIIYSKNKLASGFHEKINHEELLAWLSNNNESLIVNCTDIAGTLARKSRFLTSGILTGLLYLTSLKNEEQAEYFFTLLSTGDNIGLKNHSMIYLLRDRLMKIERERSKARTEDKVALIIKAWNFFRDSKEIKTLVYNPDKEEFPKIK